MQFAVRDSRIAKNGRTTADGPILNFFVQELPSESTSTGGRWTMPSCRQPGNRYALPTLAACLPPLFFCLPPFPFLFSLFPFLTSPFLLFFAFYDRTDAGARLLCSLLASRFSRPSPSIQCHLVSGSAGFTARASGHSSSTES